MLGSLEGDEVSPLSLISETLLEAGSDAVRLFHGRGGAVAGYKYVAVDWYAPAVFVTLYEDVAECDAFLAELDAYLVTLERVSCFAVQRRFLKGAPVEVKWGVLPDRAHESGLDFMLSLAKNQNHGFFLDMEPGRSWLRSRAEGKSVLNLFSYTCALSVAAIAGGADRVVNLDLSSRALSVGRENHRLNFDQESCRKVTYLAHDLFKTWGKLKRLGPFDIVVLDPPSHQPGSFVATKDYPRLIGRLAELLNPEGAEILACLNAPELDESFLSGLINEQLSAASCAERLPHPQGYIEAGEGWGLKRFIYKT